MKSCLRAGRVANCLYTVRGHTTPLRPGGWWCWRFTSAREVLVPALKPLPPVRTNGSRGVCGRVSAEKGQSLDVYRKVHADGGGFL